MKSKVTVLGNSHGVRMSSTMMQHLKAKAGDDIEIKFTSSGIEISNNNTSMDYLSAVTKDVLDATLAQTHAVNLVKDPYSASEVAYLVIAINTCTPLIREVPLGTKGSYTTLANAKEAARQILQASISTAQKSLSDLRQLGIDNITYISL